MTSLTAEGGSKTALPSHQSAPAYFVRLSSSYSRSTGNATYKVLEEYMRQQPAQTPFVDATSIINDNASGPCVATAALIAHLGGIEPAQIIATDYVPGMIDAAKDVIKEAGWKKVEAIKMDSHSLSFADSTFTHVISNISITNYQDPLRCLQEMRRVLKSNGVALVSIWKRFAPGTVVHRAQQLMRKDSDLMKIPKAEYFKQGYLCDKMVEAGFHNVEEHSVSVLCKGDEIKGIRELLIGDLSSKIRAQYTGSEPVTWQEAIEQAIAEEIEQFGGLEFEAWFVKGMKEKV